MPLLVFITGKQGSGKSYVAEKWARSNHAQYICIDRVLVAGGKTIPDVTRKGPTDWANWKNVSPEMREHCLRSGLRSVYRGFEGFSGDFVVEGAILCNHWFFDSLLPALGQLIPTDADPHYFYLDVSNQTIHDNVHRRAAADPKNRGHERQQFAEVADVATAHTGFDEAIRQFPGRWIAVGSTEILEAAVKALQF